MLNSNVLVVFARLELEVIGMLFPEYLSLYFGSAKKPETYVVTNCLLSDVFPKCFSSMGFQLCKQHRICGDFRERDFGGNDVVA